MGTTVMQKDKEARAFVARTLERLGAQGFSRYTELLASTPVDKVIEGLDPWAFLPTPERSNAYCSEAAGRPVLPFAQAVGEDMMACFEMRPGHAPTVIVINPWAENKADVILAELADFDAWLIYAKKVSQAVQAREPEEADDE
jgi:hypothetical protein